MFHADYWLNLRQNKYTDEKIIIRVVVEGYRGQRKHLHMDKTNR